MTVFLVRHAIAEERGPVWPDDRDRPLTVRGVARMRAIAQRLADRGVQVERIWSSPLLRARQTADVLAPLWTPAGTVELLDSLAPGHAASTVGSDLAGRHVVGPVALVGHEPDLGWLTAWMTGAESPVPFKKGGVARVDFDEDLAAGAGRLVWLVTPKIVLEE